MSTTSVTGLTAVPAYRAVAHFVKQVRKLPESRSLATLEQKVRRYVCNALSPLHGSYAEIGERWAVTQIGDTRTLMPWPRPFRWPRRPPPGKL